MLHAVSDPKESPALLLTVKRSVTCPRWISVTFRSLISAFNTKHRNKKIFRDEIKIPDWEGGGMCGRGRMVPKAMSRGLILPFFVFFHFHILLCFFFPKVGELSVLGSHRFEML